MAACLTLWFVLGKLVPEIPQQDTTPQIAQKPKPAVKPETPEKQKEQPVLTPASPAMEQVAYTPSTKRMKRKPRKQHTPVMKKAEAEMEKEDVFVMPQVSEEELAQVERNYQMWQLRQAILMEKIEMDAATMALNKKYEAYLEEYNNSIEI